MLPSEMIEKKSKFESTCKYAKYIGVIYYYSVYVTNA